MSDPVTPTDLQVSGGAGGTAADLADLRVLASTSSALAEQLADITLSAHAILIDPDWVAAAVLNPAGAIAAQARLLDALDGPGGLTWLAAEMATRAAGVSIAADAYEAADAAQAALLRGWEWFEGFSGLQYVEALVIVAGPTFPGGGIGNSKDTLLLWSDPELWLTEHPEMVDDLINSAPGALAGLPLLLPPLALVMPFIGRPAMLSVQGAVGRLASEFPDGRYALDDLDPVEDDVIKDDASHSFAPPSGVGDIIAGLGYRNTQADTQHDIIDVETVVQPDGRRAHIVNIPGTKDLSLGVGNMNSNDMVTNLHVLAGETSMREEAVAQALFDAHVDPDDPVMLVGHSQGGMVAAQAAADSADGTFGYNVTHVVTAGSPIALADVPVDVQVLSLENNHDIVPHLDGADNADRPNLTTVTFDDQRGSVGDNHALENGYSEAARAIDQSHDPALAAFTDSAAAFIADPEGRTQLNVQAFEIDRVPE
jgi:hypothetical protein